MATSVSFNPADWTQAWLSLAGRGMRTARTARALWTGELHAQIAQTPREQIWALNKAKLYHYFPQVPLEQRKPVPLLLVFALINSPAIFDLRPGNSFVEYMLKQGYEVYLLDWGKPGPEDAHLRFEDYALNYLPRAIRAMQSHSHSRVFSMLGWCIGALLSTLYASLKPADGLRNLILLTAPLDFSDKTATPFFNWLAPEYYNVDRLVDLFGNMPGEMIDFGNRMLKPVENYVAGHMRLLDMLDEPRAVESWLAMQAWLGDLVPFAGAAFRQWIVEFIRENRLMNGTLQMHGRTVDPAQMRAAVLNVVATKDHIVPPCQSRSIMERLGPLDKTLLEIDGGHIGSMAGSSARKSLWPKIDAWLAARS